MVFMRIEVLNEILYQKHLNVNYEIYIFDIINFKPTHFYCEREFISFVKHNSFDPFKDNFIDNKHYAIKNT